MRNLALSFIAFFPLLVSANQINATRGVEILVVNGVEVNGKDTYNINNGFNQLVVQMSQRLSNGSKREQFTSKPYVISFSTSDNITIKVPNVVSYIDAENKFRQGPDWRVSSNGISINYKTALLPGDEGFMPYSDLEALVSKYNNEHNIVLAADNDTLAGELEKAKLEKSQEVVKQLKLWYKKASKDEKKQFVEWLDTQNE
ncbi:YccT family protein [Vibrio sp. TRT 17S01]|uniref:YccT family protein n=1 Tax=Vibrio sp. TRT 17S01 TaxID=3418505 RepID=UPI003CF14FB6